MVLMVIMCLLSSCGSEVHEVVGEVAKDNDKVKRISKYESETIYGVYHLIGTNSEEIIQLVKQKGFVDKIDMMVIIDCKENQIKEIKILEHNESEDYGGFLTKEWFLERFKDKSTAEALRVVKMSAKDESQIVAITGATITSKAVVDGVNLCMNNYHRIKGE